MCGIIGFFDAQGNAQDAVENGLMPLRARGPDGQGIHASSKKIAIGQTRLAITGRATLPWVGKKVCIAHNGEIYNAKELAKKFSLRLSSDNDSEVILRFLEKELVNGQSLRQAVSKFMNHARGDYAIIGTCEGQLFGFRDPMGIRPLWWGRSARFFGLCSETLSLKVKNMTFPSPVLPGNLIVFDGKKEKIISLLLLKAKKPSTVEELHRVLKEAADYQTRNLNHCGVLFSGGVDSSLIATLVSKRVKKVTLFSVGMKGSLDLNHVEQVAKQLESNVSLRVREIKPEEIHSLTMESLERLERFDLLQAQLAVPMLALAQFISGKETVLFTGQGSDELFAGYSHYKQVYAKEGEKGVGFEVDRQVHDWWARNLDREDRMMAGNGLEERFLFWDQQVVKTALALPVSEKIQSSTDELRKHAIRKIAILEGVPVEVAHRKKHALQYSTGVAKQVERFFAKQPILEK